MIINLTFFTLIKQIYRENVFTKCMPEHLQFLESYELNYSLFGEKHQKNTKKSFEVFSY